MKKNGTLKSFILSISVMLMLCFTLSVKAQPDYDFTNSIQVSGTGNPSNVQVGGVYRFLNVHAVVHYTH